MPKTLTEDKLILRLTKKGFEFIHCDYINKYSYITVLCAEGHLFSRPWDQFKKLKRCPICRDILKSLPKEKYLNSGSKDGNKIRNTKYTLTEVQKSFSEAGYKLLSEQYLNCKEKLKILCPGGHIFYTSFDFWKNANYRCPYCSSRSLLTEGTVKERLKRKGFEYLGGFEDKESLITVKCSNGHIYQTSYINLRASSFNCKECSRERQLLDPFIISNYVESFGYQLAERYVKSNHKMHLICSNGHDYFSTWDNFKYNSRRCPRCGNGTSEMEKKFISKLEKIYDGKIILHDRVVLKPQELDIVLPEIRLAIELNGLYWHSECAGGKHNNYHLDKLEKCLSQNYKLITIFEDELLYKNSIVFARLRNILNINQIKIPARQCVVCFIEREQCNNFLKENHLLGPSSTVCRLGLFYKDDLVAVMTFTNSNISRSFLKREGVWELDRFCSKKDTRVIGGASKLLKHFEKTFDWKEIFSYADRRWTEGDMYKKLGFQFAHNSKPRYWYFRPDELGARRFHSYTYRKKKTEPKDKSEKELRSKQGWDWIWDCGTVKYSKYNREVI